MFWVYDIFVPVVGEILGSRFGFCIFAKPRKQWTFY